MRQLLSLTLISFFSIFLCFSSNAYAQDVIGRGAVHSDYARLAFEWNLPVQHTAKITGSNLIINFDHPYDGDVNSFTRQLSKYISSANLSDDKKTLTFSLKRKSKLRSFTMGSSVIVDLLDDNSVIEKKPALKKQESAETGFSIRSGRHSTYMRFVFDWPEPVSYKIEKDASNVLISFNKPASIDLTSVKKRLSGGYKNISFAKGSDNSVVTIPVPANSNVKDFTIKNNRIVVDILDRVKVSPEEKKDIVLAKKEPPKPKTAPVPDVARKELKETEPEIKTSPKAEEQAQKTEKLPEEVVALVEEKEKPVEEKTVEEKPVEEKTVEKKEEIVPKKRLRGMRGADFARGLVSSVSVSWNHQVAAAVFRRAGYVWVVFDKNQILDMDFLRRMGGEAVIDIKQLPHTKATILRMSLLPGYNPSLRREGFLWIIDIMRQPLAVAKEIDVTSQLTSPTGSRLFLPVEQVGNKLTLVDPEIGDVMTVVPVVPLGKGIASSRKYPDLDLPVTAQGILVLPKSDGIEVQTSTSGVEIFSPDRGLRFSKDMEKMAAIAKLGGEDLASRAFDVQKWLRGGEEEFRDNLVDLRKIVTDAPKEKKNFARLELARFYFANGYFAETLGILRVIENEKKSMAKTPAFMTLRGAAKVMMNRPEEAIKDLSFIGSEKNSEVQFWLAIAKSMIGKKADYADTLLRNSSVLRSYPQTIKTPLSLMGVEATIDAGDDLGAQNFLDAARNAGNSKFQEIALLYYKGLWNELSGAFSAALDAFREVEDSESRKYRALAAMKRIKLQLKLEQISISQAIYQLEKLRYAWRGDEFEFKLLNLLAKMYLEAGDYGEGLRMLKHMASHFREYPGADKIPFQMRRIFDRLYLEGLADQISPVKAIALYEEFKELTPTGDKGNEMIRRLADRLVAVDLLDRAAELLSNQVEYRLRGVEKGRIGTRLALVYLLGRKPESALNALKKSSVRGMSAALLVQRRHLMARALAEVKRIDDAIRLLDGDESELGIQLRAEIFWNENRWAEAADELKKLIRKPGSNKKLSEEMAQRILNWAIALRLAGKDAVVVRVRYNFMPYMKETPYFDAFNLLTGSEDSEYVDYNVVNKEIKSAEKFMNFMSKYTEQLKEDGLSRTIN